MIEYLDRMALFVAVFCTVVWLVTWPFKAAWGAWKLRKMVRELSELQRKSGGHS